MARALINVPRKARRGEIIEIKTLLSHPMETGYRRDNMGNLISRDIISRFVCVYNGTEVFQADLFPAVAANPFLSFFTVPPPTISTLSTARMLFCYGLPREMISRPGNGRLGPTGTEVWTRANLCDNSAAGWRRGPLLGL